MRTSSRGKVDPFIVMDVMEQARQREAEGHSIIHMEVGQPGIGAPTEALSRLQADMQAGPMGYTVALGLPELRARIAELYGTQHNIDLDPARVVVTASASGAFLWPLRRCLTPAIASVWGFRVIPVTARSSGPWTSRRSACRQRPKTAINLRLPISRPPTCKG